MLILKTRRKYNKKDKIEIQNVLPKLCYQISVEFFLMMLVDRPRPRPPRSLFLPETVWFVFADDVLNDVDLKNYFRYLPINVKNLVTLVIMVHVISTDRIRVTRRDQACKSKDKNVRLK